MDAVITKLVVAFTDPLQLVLFLWILALLKEKYEFKNVLEKLVESNQLKHEVLKKMEATIDSIMVKIVGGRS